MRAALYARFSSDLQNAASIADQLAVCRAHAVRLGAEVVAEFSDAAISGAAVANRPGLNTLMAAARGGGFDVVICEALDRLTRSGGDAWDIYDDLKAAGVAINTIAEGAAQTLHIGLKGTMNALFLEELARKTRRGLSGVAREGRHAGGAPAYGYRRKIQLGADGLPIPGLLDIDPDQAAIVREVFRAYAAGQSPRAIAASLNARHVPGPRGGVWNASTINGNAARGNGLLHNALYAGEMVWGRQSWVKDRKTGKRRARTAGPQDLIRTPAPELAIVDKGLWDAVQAQVRAMAAGARPERSRRPKRLLSGLLRCGCCDGPMIAGGPDGRMLCSRRRERGAAACANGRTAKAVDIEARVLTAIREQMLAPELVETFVREFHAEYARRAKDDGARRARLERELGEVSRRAERLVDQIADGLVAGVAVNDRLRTLETRRAEISAELAGMDDVGNMVRLHPGAAAVYRRRVEQLQAAIGDDAGDAAAANAESAIERDNARAALRALITGVIIKPRQERGQYDIEIEGDLAPLLRPKAEEGVSLAMGAGAGFEPATFRL